MSPIYVIGVGAAGATGLSAESLQAIGNATLLVGSSRHLALFPDVQVPRLTLTDLSAGIAKIQQRLSVAPFGQIVILASGDPLFYGLGRLLLTAFPAEQLTFYPHISAVQLAFSRLKTPWQDALVVSIHGRSPVQLVQAIQQGQPKIAILTDPTYTPSEIATLLLRLDVPVYYQLWVCENLGAPNEKIQSVALTDAQSSVFAPLNIVVLIRCPPPTLSGDLATPYPKLGIPDRHFFSFPDRPSLITKREVRVIAIALLELQDNHVIWDIGAGTGSVSIEMARVSPSSTVYAIERTTIGCQLIQQNSQRFQTQNLQAIYGKAPAALEKLPAPDRIFIGGSQGQICPILDYCESQLSAKSIIVLALTTLENFEQANQWLQRRPWSVQRHQIQISRSVAIANLTRWQPLNPVTIIQAKRDA